MGYNPFAHLENPELSKENTELNNKYNLIPVSADDIKNLKSESPFSPKNWKSIEDRNKRRREILKKEKLENNTFNFEDFSNWEREFIKVGENWKKIENDNSKTEETRSFDTEKWESKIFKENSKYSSLIIRLYETWKIQKDTKNILLSEDLDNVDNISKIEWINDKNEIKSINTVFEKVKNKPKNLQHFQKEINILKDKQYLKGFDLEIKDWKYDSEVLNMIWWNYIEFPNSENKKEREKDLSVAIELTKNEIERRYTNFSRESESYRVAINNIKSGVLEKQMEWIKTLYVLASSRAWELSQKKLDKYITKREEKIISEYQKLNKEFDILEAQKTTEKINNRKKEINQRIIEIWNEANEIEAWDIFKAWKLDQKDESGIEKNKQ